MRLRLAASLLAALVLADAMVSLVMADRLTLGNHRHLGAAGTVVSSG